MGPYQLLTRLAAGERGEVFIARRSGAGAGEEKVALKLLLPQLLPDPEFVRRFFEQARQAAQLSHPNLVQIFDVGESDRRPYLTMALVEGISLARVLELSRTRKQPVPLPIVRLIGNGLLEGLAYAQSFKGSRGEELGLIHRDLRPSNLLLSTAGGVLLNDFGIPAVGEDQTRPGTEPGRFAYLSPEQAHRGRPTARSDFFSAGATLYELATLVSSFARGGEVETLDAVRKHQPAAARTLRPELSEQMSRALERALEKNPEERFATARQFRDAFVDGPMATPAELGAWVQLLGAEDLRAFQLGRPPGPAVGPIGATPGGLKSRTRLLVLSLAGLAAGAAGYFALQQNGEAAPIAVQASSATGADAGQTR